MTEVKPPAGAKIEQVTRAAARRIQVEGAVGSTGPTLALLGVDRQTDAPVVMRVLRPELGAAAGALERFLRVGEQAMRVRSAHLANVLEVGRLGDDGPGYWLAERAPGTSLRELAGLGRPVPVRIVVDYAVEICEALEAAHAAGLVHGLLRPSKVFRLPVADPVRIKVIDLGLAAATLTAPARGMSLPPPSAELMSPEYRSPEMVAGSRRFEVGADLWGLGLVAFELLTGRHPFVDATTRSALARAVAGGPPPLGTLGLSIPSSLEDLLRELLRKDASQRPASAATVADRLREVAHSLGMDPGARAASAAEKSRGGGARASAPGGASLGGSANAQPSPASSAGSSSDREPTDSEGPASSGRPRFVGPALGNLGVRGGSYSLSGGALPAEEVVGRRRAAAARRAERVSKRPSQRPRKSRPSPAQRRSGQPPAPPATDSTTPAPAGRRRRAIVRTDPATPRAMVDRQPPPPPLAQTASPTPAPSEAAPSPARPAPAEQPAPFELDLDVAPLPSRVRSVPPSLPTSTPPAAAAPSGKGPTGGGALDGDDQSRPKLRTAPGSWTLDLQSGPGSWEIERIPSVPPPRAPADSPTPAPGAVSARSVPPSMPRPAQPAADDDEPEVSVAVEEQFGPFQIERTIDAGSRVERLAATALGGPLEGEPVFIDRAEQSVAITPERPRWIAATCRAAPHPHLVAVLDEGTIDGSSYVAFEAVDGLDLRTLLRTLAAEPPDSLVLLAAYVARCVALGLSELHRALGVEAAGAVRVHGDVRPSNVMVSRQGEVKLGPPSIACDRRGARCDKLDFIAPEELRDEPIDARADLFALGVLLGEMLVGGPIFPGRGVDVLMAVDRVSIDPLWQKAASWPDGLRRVCERALGRIATDRFGSALEFATALQPIAESGPDAQALLAERVRAALAAATRRASDAAPEPERSGRTSLAATAEAAAGAADGADSIVRVRRAHSGLMGQMPVAGLLEAVATGHLGPDDEVAWGTDAFRTLAGVPLCAERLLLSAPAVRGNLTERRAADHLYQSRSATLLETLAQMRLCHANAFVLVEDTTSESDRRTEIYLREGAVVGVRSSDPSELLGARLLQLGRIRPEELERACRRLHRFEGKVGNALVGLGLLDAVTTYRAIREQACARIARLFSLAEWRTRVYLGQGPPPSAWGLQIDLTEPMMAGLLAQQERDPASLLPGMLAPIEPGPRAPGGEERELADLPTLLRETARLVGTRPVVSQAIRLLEASAGVSARAAAAALVVAQALRWIIIRAPRS